MTQNTCIITMRMKITFALTVALFLKNNDEKKKMSQL